MINLISTVYIKLICIVNDVDMTDQFVQKGRLKTM